jgi:hypothetical protein
MEIWFFLFVCFFLVGLGFQDFMLAKQTLYHLSHISSSFCSDYFENGVIPTICLGWP